VRPPPHWLEVEQPHVPLLKQTGCIDVQSVVSPEPHWVQEPAGAPLSPPVWQYG
jgi:hypothetical protein